MLKTSDCAGVQTSIGEGCRRSPKNPTSASRDSCRRRSRGVDTRSYIRGRPVTQTKVRQQVDRKGSVQGSSPISQRCEKTQESLGGSASLSVSRVLVQQGSVWGEHGRWRWWLCCSSAKIQHMADWEGPHLGCGFCWLLSWIRCRDPWSRQKRRGVFRVVPAKKRAG